MYWTANRWPKTLHFYADYDWRDGLGKSTWVGRCVEVGLCTSRCRLETLLPVMDRAATMLKEALAANPKAVSYCPLGRYIAGYIRWLFWPRWARWTSRG